MDIEFDPNIKLSRIGKSYDIHRDRLLRLEFPTENSPVRHGLLTKGKLLRGHSVYDKVFINPDLNQMQIERNKTLIAELKHRRSQGDDVIIKQLGVSRKVVLRPR